MLLDHGYSFEMSGGPWRKLGITADTDDFPEAINLTPEHLVLYVSVRLEQRMLALRHLYGNVTDEQYSGIHARLEALADGYLGTAVDA